MTQQTGGLGCLVGFGGWRSHVILFAVPPSPSTLDMGVHGWFPLAGLPWIPPCFAFDSVRPPPTFWAPSPNAHLLVMSLNEAKCNLGKVKLESMQYRTSGVAHGIWQGFPWLRLQLHFTPADLCGSFAIVLWRIIADSRSCCIMNRQGTMLKRRLQILADIGLAWMAKHCGILLPLHPPSWLVVA